MQEPQKTKVFSVRNLVAMAVFAALSVVLVWLVHFPIFPATPFLEYDPADVTILMSGFLFGPLSGFAVTLVASTVQAFTVSARSGLYGLIMHLIATGTLVMVSSVVYKKFKTSKGAIVALLLGSFAMTAVMIPANLLVTPLFTGWPVQDVIGLLHFIVLFNLIKALGNSLLTFLLYKRVGGLLK